MVNPLMPRSDHATTKRVTLRSQSTTTPTCLDSSKPRMESLPATQAAVIATEDDPLVVNESTPVPHLDPDIVIVKNEAACLNPVDTKTEGLYSCRGAILGCDFTGTAVVAVDSEVKNPLQVGDRVSGEVM